MYRQIGVFLLSLLWFSPVSAADAPSLAKRGPLADEFYRLHGELNGVLAELAGLQARYRTADEDKQATIRQQWDEVIAKGQPLELKLLETAEKAYAESPNRDKQITDFLVGLLAQDVQRDDYEPADEIGKLLVENKCTDKRVANLAGIAAFAVNDFDAAEKYLNQAAKDGYYTSAAKDDKLAQVGGFYLSTVSGYKQLWMNEKAIRDTEAKADDLPRVLLKTNKGDIVLELFEDQAPNTVANFIWLVKKGRYNGLAFHRVLQGFMAQGGDPAGNGTGGPGYNIACECYRPDHRKHFRGALSMAHAGRDTGGSQFFITFVPTPHLDGRHTVFGRVIAGMDVLANLQRRDPNDKESPRPDKIIEAKVLRKRPHDYLPKKMLE